MAHKEVHKDIYLPLYCDNNASPIKYTLFWKHTHTDWNIFLLIHFFIWKVTCKRKTHCGLILTWFYCHTISEKRANTLCKNEVMFTKKSRSKFWSLKTHHAHFWPMPWLTYSLTHKDRVYEYYTKARPGEMSRNFWQASLWQDICLVMAVLHCTVCYTYHNKNAAGTLWIFLIIKCISPHW